MIQIKFLYNIIRICNFVNLIFKFSEICKFNLKILVNLMLKSFEKVRRCLLLRSKFVQRSHFIALGGSTRLELKKYCCMVFEQILKYFLKSYFQFFLVRNIRVVCYVDDIISRKQYSSEPAKLKLQNTLK